MDGLNQSRGSATIGSLGRGEAYHQLRRHIEKVNGRHFRGTNETQISVWNEAARLLANCVLYYSNLKFK